MPAALPAQAALQSQLYYRKDPLALPHVSGDISSTTTCQRTDPLRMSLTEGPLDLCRLIHHYLSPAPNQIHLGLSTRQAGGMFYEGLDGAGA